MDHIDEANTRTRWIFGCPFGILVLAAVICLIISIVGIVAAIGDVDFEATLDEVPGEEPVNTLIDDILKGDL